ncbi:MAG: hypothetical protein ABI901_09220 [Roseiflexaceae bacterium]
MVGKQIQRLLSDLVRNELAKLAPRAATPVALEIVVQYTCERLHGLPLD